MRYVAGAFSLLVVVAVAAPSFAAQRTTTLGGVRANIGGKVTTGGTFGTTGGGTSQLTSSDCWAVGGTVITPGDDRCGVGGKYCRLPDTNAICIQEAAQ